MGVLSSSSRVVVCGSIVFLWLWVAMVNTQATLPSFHIDPSSIAVSGVSSGAAMSIQFHVSHSSIISGVGSIAGPPYYCAQADVGVATTVCESDYHLISVTELIAATDYAFTLDSIDDPSLISRANAYLFTGSNDTVVVPGVVMKSLQYYQHYIKNSDQIQLVSDIPAEHSWVTGGAYSYGEDCQYLGTPYINNCDYDAAGAILQHIYGSDLKSPVPSNPNNIISFNQQDYTPLKVAPSTISMDEKGFVYVPTDCQNLTNVCKLMVVFHGCEQTYNQLGTVFIENTGMNEWAEANNIVVLYPQAIPSDVPYNPLGCWDWWGYTGEDYATKLGTQIITIKAMIDQLTSGQV